MNGAEREPRRQLPTTAARENNYSATQFSVEDGGLLENVFLAIKVTFVGN